MIESGADAVRMVFIILGTCFSAKALFWKHSLWQASDETLQTAHMGRLKVRFRHAAVPRER